MTIKKAKISLEYFGRERDNAHASNMDWMPDRNSRNEIAAAVGAIQASKRSASEILNRAGYSLFESETLPR